MIRHIKQMDNNCHIPDFVQAFSFKCRKWLIKPGLFKFQYIENMLELNRHKRQQFTNKGATATQTPLKTWGYFIPPFSPQIPLNIWIRDVQQLY